VTQAMNLPKVKPKIVFDINSDHLALSMVNKLFIHVWHLRRLVNSWKHRWQFKKDISIESNRQKLNFLTRYLVIIQIWQLVGGMSREHHNTEVRNNKLNIAD
jgi:hypothetical protein